MKGEIIRWLSGSVEVELSTLGAELQFVSVDGGKNLLWSKNDIHWNRVAPHLFPIVGRLKGDQYHFRGDVYSMRQHGFARDRVFDVVEKGPASIRLRLRWDADTFSLYPFEFQYDVVYRVEKRFLWVEYEVRNLGDSNLLYSVGGHPGFAIEGELHGYELRFQQDFVADRWLIDGGYYSGETTLMDVKGVIALDEKLFEQDAIVFRNPPFDRVSLYEKGGEKCLDFVCSDWDAVGFWTKPGAPFFCIEPWWGWADAWLDSGDFTKKLGLHQLVAGGCGFHRYGLGIMD